MNRAARRNAPVGVLGQKGWPMRAALYTQVSAHGQQTLAMQTVAMRSYITDRGWTAEKRVEDIDSRAKGCPERESLLKAARRREVDVVVVWRLELQAQSMADPTATPRVLTELGVGSCCELRRWT